MGFVMKSLAQKTRLHLHTLLSCEHQRRSHLLSRVCVLQDLQRKGPSSGGWERSCRLQFYYRVEGTVIQNQTQRAGAAGEQRPS